MNSDYFVLAYYHFTSIANPHKEIAAHKAFLKGRDMTCRIYISEDGINGQTSGIKEDAEAYMQWMHSNPLFAKMPFKIHTYHENAFPRQIVKYRKQLVAIDEKIDLANAGEHVAPERWKEMLKTGENQILLDVRNSYEWEVGRFEGAECPPCETFREFKEYAYNLKSKVDPEKTPVMMYCTGGIRCELYSALLKKEGFKDVYQLEGGIINYGLKEGTEHWLGKLFVFDDRLTVPISDEEAPVIGKCLHCQVESESYYNCANMDCNHLFLCCPPCIEKFAGCCCEECKTAPHVRPYQHQNPHKPFRRWYNYFSEDKNKAQEGSCQIPKK
ncbi:MAG: rhodanese-related sulfurtransferase [Parachlamydiaceae bacterium]|nr:rhodanese-related sulfurtransferase [Parachlamydiaceae bacterium]